MKQQQRASQTARQFERAQRLAGIGSWEWDIPGDQITWSNELYRLFNVEPGDFEPSYEAFLELIHPDDRQEVDAIVQEAFRSGNPFEVTHRVVHGDAIIRGHGAVESKRGRPVLMYGIAQDITASKTAEDRLRSLLQATPDPIVLVDRAGTIQFANDQVRELLGYEPKELLGAAVEMLIPFDLRSVHRDHRKSFNANPRRRAMGEGRELLALHRNGTKVPVEVSLGPLDLDGEHMVLAALRNVEDRKHVEAKLRANETRLRAVVENALDAIIILDEQGRVKEWNPAAESMFGRPRDAVIDQDFITRFVPAKQRRRFQSMAGRVLKGHQEVWEGPLLRGEGAEGPTEIGAGPMDTDEGRCLLAICRDLSERRRSEAADRVAFERLLEIQQLKEVNRMKTTLLNTASHELKTPMTPLRLQLHLLSTGALGPLTDKQQHAVKVLSRNAERLSDLIADVLDVARMESGRLNLSHKPTQINLLIEEAVEMFAETARKEGKRIEIEAPRHVVDIDPDRILQVLINLISNALKFSNDGGMVHVRATPTDGVRIEVTDEGLGLDPRQIGRLFEPFSQVHDRSKVDVAGTGLGLYICKAIVEEHGGEMGVDSEGPGKGSTFWLALPPTPPDESEEGPGE